MQGKKVDVPEGFDWFYPQKGCKSYFNFLMFNYEYGSVKPQIFFSPLANEIVFAFQLQKKKQKEMITGSSC